MIDLLDDPNRGRWRLSSDSDVTDIVGALMKVAGGSELSVIDVEGLTFVATGELETALNEAFIKLLEFAHDANIRARDSCVDRALRQDLQLSLKKVGWLAGTSVRVERLISISSKVLHPAVF